MTQMAYLKHLDEQDMHLDEAAADDDAARRTALEDLAALAFAQRSAQTERAAAKRARHRGAFDVFSSSEA